MDETIGSTISSNVEVTDLTHLFGDLSERMRQFEEFKTIAEKQEFLLYELRNNFETKCEVEDEASMAFSQS